MQGFKEKVRKEEPAPASPVAVEEAVGTAEAALSPVLEPVEPPAVSSTQPLWLQQNNLATDVSSFAPKIVVVGVGGAGGNAGACRTSVFLRSC